VAAIKVCGGSSRDAALILSPIVISHEIGLANNLYCDTLVITFCHPVHIEGGRTWLTSTIKDLLATRDCGKKQTGNKRGSLVEP
jgi:hypothetical protein